MGNRRKLNPKVLLQETLRGSVGAVPGTDEKIRYSKTKFSTLI